MSKFELCFHKALIEEIMRDKRNNFDRKDLEIMTEGQLKCILDNIVMGKVR